MSMRIHSITRALPETYASWTKLSAARKTKHNTSKHTKSQTHFANKQQLRESVSKLFSGK